MLVLLGGVVWQFGPFQAVFAIAQLSDQAKLATLGARGANPRLNKIVYWLGHAERRGLSANTAVTLAQWMNWTREPRAGLVREALLRNLNIARRLGLAGEENETRLRQGRSAVVGTGPYRGSAVEIDHIVPFSLAPEAGNELANLEMLPQLLNRKKSNRVGSRQLAHAEKLAMAGLISHESLVRVRAQAARNPTDDAE